MLQIRFIDRVKFLVERQFVKGAAWQVFMVMLFIGLLSLVGGLLVLPVAAEFGSAGEAVWWAFLRLTDPGYLGDDEGTWRRVVSTLLTVASYVVFLGTLVAIMTRKLIAIMADLERGLTPVSLRNHVVVLGWNSRTLPILRELLSAPGRVRRFLERHETRRLRLVVLSEHASAQQRHELTGPGGIGRGARRVILRSGSPLQPDALQRVACLEAAAVIVPSRAIGPDGLVTSDVETVKALLSIAAEARLRGVPPPLAVVELQDVRKRAVVERAYRGSGAGGVYQYAGGPGAGGAYQSADGPGTEGAAGPGLVEVVAGDATISRLLVQNIRQPGLAALYRELLGGGDGNELYVRSGEAMGRTTLELLAMRCPQAIVLGLLRSRENGWDVQLVADTDSVIEPADRVVMLARSYEETEPARVGSLPAIARRNHVSMVAPDEPARRVLVLGWSRRVPALLAEFACYPQHRFEVDLVSVVAPVVREREIARFAGDLTRVIWRQIEADYMVDSELRRLHPEHYDVILLLGNDRLASGEEADARAMLGHLQLEEILSLAEGRPQVIVELSDPHNQALLHLQQSEVMVSPLIISHLLAQVALRRELRVVFDHLFSASGAEFRFSDPRRYALTPRADFQELERTVADCGEIALGVYRAVVDAEGRRLLLNPPRRTPLALQPGDRIVILARGS